MSYCRRLLIYRWLTGLCGGGGTSCVSGTRGFHITSTLEVSAPVYTLRLAGLYCRQIYSPRGLSIWLGGSSDDAYVARNCCMSLLPSELFILVCFDSNSLIRFARKLMSVTRIVDSVICFRQSALCKLTRRSDSDHRLLTQFSDPRLRLQNV